jgi:hypothetical protein
MEIGDDNIPVSCLSRSSCSGSSSSTKIKSFNHLLKKKKGMSQKRIKWSNINKSLTMINLSYLSLSRSTKYFNPAFSSYTVDTLKQLL